MDEGGKPNFPDKEIQVSVSLNNNEVSAQVACPPKTVIQTSGANESFSDTTSSSGRSESASGIGSCSENAYGTGSVSEHGSDAASSSGVPPNTFSGSNSYNPGSASVLSNCTSAKEYSPDIGTSANSYDEEDLSAMPMPSPPESVRNSFTFVPEGANEDTVSKFLIREEIFSLQLILFSFIFICSCFCSLPILAIINAIDVFSYLLNAMKIKRK